jgi:hypothetical protein
MNNKNKYIRLSIEFIESLFQASGIIIFGTIIAIMISMVYSFLYNVTVSLPFDCFTVINETVDDKIGISINYQNNIFTIILVLTIILSVLISIIKILRQANLKNINN